MTVDTNAPDQYLICKHGGYYRPNAQGYTNNVADAGRYTLAEAIRHTHPNGTDGPRDGMTYILAPPRADLVAVVTNLDTVEVGKPVVLRLWDNGGGACYFEPYEVTDLHEAAVRKAREVKVRALEWEAFQDKTDGRIHYGYGVFGHWYSVRRHKAGAWECSHYIKSKPVTVMAEGSACHDTLEAAKAAAQADYERRIREALE